MKEIINKTIENLFLLEDNNNCNIPIIYPKYRNNDKVRISEQEAKQIFIHEVIKKGFKFSVETPTKERYSFSGNGSRSGCIDLSVYSDDLKSQTNIEFKFGNVDKNLVQKDFEKLILEDATGIFFHLIKSTNSRTLLNISKKYTDAINEVLEKNEKNSQLTLVLISLKDKYMFRHIFNTKQVRKDKEYLDKLLQIKITKRL